MKKKKNLLSATDCRNFVSKKNSNGSTPTQTLGKLESFGRNVYFFFPENWRETRQKAMFFGGQAQSSQKEKKLNTNLTERKKIEIFVLSTENPCFPFPIPPPPKKSFIFSKE